MLNSLTKRHSGRDIDACHAEQLHRYKNDIIINNYVTDFTTSNKIIINLINNKIIQKLSNFFKTKKIYNRKDNIIVHFNLYKHN